MTVSYPLRTAHALLAATRDPLSRGDAIRSALHDLQLLEAHGDAPNAPLTLEAGVREILEQIACMS